MRPPFLQAIAIHYNNQSIELVVVSKVLIFRIHVFSLKQIFRIVFSLMRQIDDGTDL